MQPYVQLDEKYLHNTVSTVLCLLNFLERGFLELFSVCAICAFFSALLSFWMKLSLLVLVHSKGGLLHLRTAAVRLHSPPSPCRVPPRCCFLLTAFCELEIQAIESSKKMRLRKRFTSSRLSLVPKYRSFGRLHVTALLLVPWPSGSPLCY